LNGIKYQPFEYIRNLSKWFCKITYYYNLKRSINHLHILVTKSLNFYSPIIKNHLRNMLRNLNY